MTKLTNDLNKLLATTAVFAQKVSNFHWNMKGKLFMQYHKMTDELYEGLQGFIDKIAEKVLMQGGMPLATLEEFLAHSAIKEIKPKVFSTDEVVELICQDLDIYAHLLEKCETNKYVQPLLDELFTLIDMQRWFFNSSK